MLQLILNFRLNSSVEISSNFNALKSSNALMNGNESKMNNLPKIKFHHFKLMKLIISSNQ